MAKKPRTPPPPRKVQAPKQRHDPRKGMDPQRQRMLLYGFAGAGIVGLGIALIIVFAGGKKTADVSPETNAKVKKTMLAAGCTFTSKPVLKPKDGKNFHNDYPKLTTKGKWSTFPPSGGGHYGAWAIWNFYTDPVNLRMVGHNLEHGGVILYWGPGVSGTTVSKLREFYDSSPNAMLGTPVPGLGSKVAIAAWTGDPSRYYKNGYYGIGKLAVCKRYDESAFATFRDGYRGHGPEGIPLSADKPGSGPGA